MGIIRTPSTLFNPAEAGVSPVRTDALVDTGSLFLCLPQHVAMQLKLAEPHRREVTVADGSRQWCPYVGPVQVAVANRTCFTGAPVLGDEVLLGTMPMEDMDLVIAAARRTVEPNPANPDMAATSVK